MEDIFDVELTGTTPLLIHSFPLNEKRYPISQEWKNHTNYKKEIGVFLNSKNIIKCLRYGFSSFIKQENTIKIKGKTLYSIRVNPFEIPVLNYNELIDSLDTIEKNNWINITKMGNITRYRTVLTNWSMKFEIVSLGNFTQKELNIIINHAGKYSGLGDWRPSSTHPGTFGTFTANIF